MVILLAPTANPRAPTARRVRWVLVWLGLLLWLQVASAQTAAQVGSAPWRAQMSQWLGDAVGEQLRTDPAGRALRVDIEVGALDSRLRLAPCQRVEPYVPTGTRLWGRSRIGLRCTEGPVAWNVFLPIYVRVWGPGWVLRRPVAPGDTLTPDVAELTEVDWTLHRDPVLARPQDWQGREAARALAAGQVLRATVVRAPQVFEAGATVRLRVEGQGFILTATGEALGDGRVGEPVRVRLANRRVLVGTVVDAQTVALPL
ncbi:flagellar basal body P-ring formation chaperone FlgA [Tepidimonas thermarum]|uniref:flagellar basal body P-ring formation chaperone FlgA n=1 Tax=Tepidimonas thermarum TaxID=335431 RepID=UPI00117F37C3|nr:flagellar basal body P-ring formation chaperone FlgA [Tepidimonas thermarum]